MLKGETLDIESVIVDGRFVLREYRILTLDEDALMEVVEWISERVWGWFLRNGELSRL